MIEKLSAPFVVIGMLLIVGALLTPIVLNATHPAVGYVYAAGALLLLLGRMFYTYYGKNVRLRRLHRLETWSALIFCVGAFFIFYDPTNMRDAIAFTLAGAIIQIYTSIMIPRERAKESEE